MIFDLKLSYPPTTLAKRKQRTDRTPALILGLIMVFLVGNVTSAFSENQKFSSPEHLIQFSYPASLTLSNNPIPQALVSLKGPYQGYPSFNIIIAAETFDPTSFNDSRYRDKILSEYKAVGLTDVKAQRTYSAPVAGKLVHTTELLYQLQGQPLLSAVTLVPHSLGKHLILTYIDVAPEFYRRKITREEIVNSLQVGENSAAISDPAKPGTGSPEDSPDYWLIAASLVALILLAGVAFFKSRNRS